MRLRAALGLAALVVVCLAGAAFGQGFQGGLRGAIKDSGGVVPGVEVTLTNDQTNIKRSVVTNERGEYAFANVDPGTYSVKATIQGYKTVDRTGIRIATQSFLLLDLTLEVGAIEEGAEEREQDDEPALGGGVLRRRRGGRGWNCRCG